MSTMSGFAATRASSPARTEAWRVAPPLTGGAYCRPRTASSKTEASSGFTTGCTATTWGCLQNGSIARKITGCPPIERYCFGPPVPARRPRPAATRMAAVRGGFGMGFRLSVDWVGKPQLFAGAQPLSCSCREDRTIPLACEKIRYFAAVHLQDRRDCLKCRHET